MPCPPSLEERVAAAAGRDVAAARRFAAELGPALDVLAAVVDLVPETLRAQHAASIEARLREDREARIDAEPDWYHDPSQSEALSTWASNAAGERQRLEVALCETRTLLVVLWDALSARPPELAARVAREEAAHREHREADRARVIANLEAQRRSAEQRAGDPKMPADARTYWQREESTLAAKVAEAKRVPIERLLRDRTLP